MHWKSIYIDLITCARLIHPEIVSLVWQQPSDITINFPRKKYKKGTQKIELKNKNKIELTTASDYDTLSSLTLDKLNNKHMNLNSNASL